MLEHSLPPAFLPASRTWEPADLGRLGQSLESHGAKAIAAVSSPRRQAAWHETMAELAEAGSPLRQALAPPLQRATGLSPQGLEAALETMLASASGPATEELFRRAEGRQVPKGLGTVVLAATPPGLAAQALLAPLALGIPMLLKSARAEPFFAPALVETLCRHEPGLRPALAALTWPGGDSRLEAPLLNRARRILAYGDGSSLEDLGARAGTKLLAQGPKISLAILGQSVDTASVANGLARDIALFDQRGCLSIQAIYTVGNALELAEHLATALRERALIWPQGLLMPGTLAAIQQLRTEAEMRGLEQPSLAIEAGTVIVEQEPTLLPSPGGRCVRIYPVPNLRGLPALLAPWRNRLQGVAWAGEEAGALEPSLRDLGCSRLAPPGDLQRTDALWANGGVSPLAIWL